MSARLVVVMGSGETAPTMVTLHRRLAAALPAGRPPGSAVLVETPYGFQENADDVSAKAVRYFADSVGLEVTVPPGLRSHDDPQAERGLAAVAGARWCFAGPGSPTYALTHWRGALGAALRARVDPRTAPPGVTVFASAAAAALGDVAAPIYEVYKAGLPPVWVEGLAALVPLGLRGAVVPHFDNAEGGHYDTRFCYLGERRLARLEATLPPDAGILGVDEHTAAVLDLDTGVVEVVGRGGLTARHRGRVSLVPAGERVPVEVLAGLLSGQGGGGSVVPSSQRLVDDGTPETPATSLSEMVAGAERDFAAALEAGDGAGMAAAALGVQRALLAWSGDTLQSDEADRAHAVLRSMLVRLGEAADRGAALVGPLAALRDELRAARAFDLADRLRDMLAAAGVAPRDEALGVRSGVVEAPPPLSSGP